MYKISWWRVNFGDNEIGKISESVKRECFSQGPVTEEFERGVSAMLNVPYVAATTSGSMALLMSLMAAGIGPGDKVIVPNRTWIASAHAVLMAGAEVTFIDVETERPVMDVTQLEKIIQPATKAIMPVHMNGRAVNMKEINTIADKHGLIVIEDAAQAFCSKHNNVSLGTESFAGCFSMSMGKLLSTGQGGFVVTKDTDTYNKLRMLRTHGLNDIINVKYTSRGFNFKFTDIAASIGVVGLEHMPGRIERVKAIYKKYETALSEFPFLKLIPVDTEHGELPIYVEVLCAERDKLIKFLADRGIQARPTHPNLNTAAYFKDNNIYPNSELFAQQELVLPCGPDQPMENVERLIEALKDYS
ncbi:DegT/DnrJ/EryC1/StrS family aminotransferase [Candidatus Magnetomonas plexicatena]|uniref:DegT/DnrJ/EryC1/StrS family aminotransferase n=1 Tax=Candidatus Magnetomonas plexicatena TaxID=2552947 RepID=UPI0010FFDB40|nr:DegT/DnrJ/EryC1/StrS family aminotransferase [Nitrospirales bacterium LBB_01]